MSDLIAQLHNFATEARDVFGMQTYALMFSKAAAALHTKEEQRLECERQFQAQVVKVGEALTRAESLEAQLSALRDALRKTIPYLEAAEDNFPLERDGVSETRADLEQAKAALVYAHPSCVSPDKPQLEVRNNPDGTLDEVVGTGTFHLEQMDTGHWWLGIGHGPLLHVNLRSRNKITVTVLDERDTSCVSSDQSKRPADSNESADHPVE